MKAVLRVSAGRVNHSRELELYSMPRVGETLTIVDNDGVGFCAKEILESLLVGLGEEYTNNLSPYWDVIDVTHGVCDKGLCSPVITIKNEAW